MDMLETYLDAVAAQLPRDAADDIVAELRDTLLSQFEEREEGLGRPLTDEEREEVLRAMGHPLVVAARYRKGPQMLIGPELFPYWLFAVKAGLLIMAAVYALTLMLKLAGSPLDAGQAVAQSFHGLFGAGLTVIGLVTLAGALCEHLGLRPPYLDTWRVKDLEILKFGDPARWAKHLGIDASAKKADRDEPEDFPGGGAGMRAPEERPAPGLRVKKLRGWPGSDAFFSLIGGLVFAAWWAGLLHIPGLARYDLDGGTVTVAGAPIWAELYLPILVYVLVQVAVDAVGVLQPAAVRLRAALQIPVALVGIALAWTILNAGTWFILSRAGVDVPVGRNVTLVSVEALRGMHGLGHTLQGTATGIGVITAWVLLITMISLGFKIGKSLWLLLAPRRYD
jgi:hypothetical protein